MCNVLLTATTQAELLCTSQDSQRVKAVEAANLRARRAAHLAEERLTEAVKNQAPDIPRLRQELAAANADIKTRTTNAEKDDGLAFFELRELVASRVKADTPRVPTEEDVEYNSEEDSDYDMDEDMDEEDEDDEEDVVDKEEQEQADYVRFVQGHWPTRHARHRIPPDQIFNDCSRLLPFGETELEQLLYRCARFPDRFFRLRAPVLREVRFSMDAPASARHSRTTHVFV